MGVARVGAARHGGDVRHGPRRDDDGPRSRLEDVDDLLDRDEGALGRQQGLLLHSGDPPQHHVAGGVGLLGVDDRHIRVDRRYGGQLLAGERAGDRRQRRRVPDEVGAAVAAQDCERQAGRPGGVAVGHPRMAVLFDLQRPWPAVLDRVAETVQRADARVAAPREDQLADAPCADHLVVDDVGGHPHDREIAPALANDLVTGGNRDEMREPFEGEGVAVVDQFGDRRAQRGVCGHRGNRLRATRRQPRSGQKRPAWPGNAVNVTEYDTQSVRVCVK